MIQKRRIENKSSRTAAYTCFSRGCATRERDPRFRGSDYIAEKMFPPLARLVLNIALARKMLMKTMFPPGIYEYVFVRTRIMDSVFLSALENQFEQIVLLGAGFDTRAIRFASLNRGTKIFELDAPATQKAKIKVMLKKKLKIPSNLIFVPIDFNKEDLLEMLSKNGYKEKVKTLFLWEGVTMYISSQAVDDTLEFIQNYSAPGSQVVFDYIFASVLRNEKQCYGEEGVFQTVSSVGEEWTFGLEKGEIEPFLLMRGFKCVAHYSPLELEKQYLTDDNGKLHGRINGTHCIAIAENKGENDGKFNVRKT